MLTCDCVTPGGGAAAEPVGVGGFEIGYVTDDGLEHRVSLSQAWATPFESCSPIRRFTSHKGPRHLSWRRNCQAQIPNGWPRRSRR